jgi:lantibiotic modifying enzyme
MNSFAAQRWPSRVSGLAFGAEGWLWAWRQGIEAGLLREDARLLRTARRRLACKYAGDARCASLFEGSAARPLVFVLLARRHEELWRNWSFILDEWIQAAGHAAKTDVMAGSAGALLSCAEIEVLAPGRLPMELVLEFHRRTLRGLRSLMARARAGDDVQLGMAHGFAGYLMSLEMARVSFGLSWSNSIRSECLNWIMRERRLSPRRSAAWREQTGMETNGWCNGYPGIGLAFLACRQVTGEKFYWPLAEHALHSMLRRPPRGGASFCCGIAGQVQILIEAYRATRKKSWLTRARSLAQTIVHQDGAPRAAAGSFHNGVLGKEYMVWRLHYPDSLPLPGLGLLSVASENKRMNYEA